MYRKDHTTIFSLWSKKVIPSPPLGTRYRLTKMTREVKQSCHRTRQHFSVLRPSYYIKKSQKERSWQDQSQAVNVSLGINPMKVRRPNFPEIKMTELDAIDMDNKAPFPVRVCHKFGLSCSFLSRALHIHHLKSQSGQVK